MRIKPSEAPVTAYCCANARQGDGTHYNYNTMEEDVAKETLYKWAESCML